MQAHAVEYINHTLQNTQKLVPSHDRYIHASAIATAVPYQYLNLLTLVDIIIGFLWK